MKSCLSIPSGIIGRMDTKADPCTDFYQYSCGGWVEKTAIPDSRISFSTFSELSTRNKQTIKLEMNKITSKTKNTSVSEGFSEFSKRAFPAF